MREQLLEGKLRYPGMGIYADFPDKVEGKMRVTTKTAFLATLRGKRRKLDVLLYQRSQLCACVHC